MKDQDLAGLLGEAPAAPDPAFRFEVLARVAERARRRIGYTRAARMIVASSAIGGFFPLARAAGFTMADAQPLLYAAIAVGLAYFLAREAVKGPSSALARGLLRLRL